MSNKDKYVPKSSYAPSVARELKAPTYYKGILRKTDTGLHDQLASYLHAVFGSRRLRILDWGCGEGALSEKLADDGHDVLAVDIDSTAWKGNRARFVKLDFNDSAALEKFVNQHIGQFDVVLCVEVIEHIEAPWTLLREVRRFGCDLIVTTPNISSWWGRLWFFLTGDLWGFTQDGWIDPGHINAIGVNEMTNMLNDVGFKIEYIFPGGRLPIIWAYNWKRFLISLVMLIFRPLMKGYKDGWALCFHASVKLRA